MRSTGIKIVGLCTTASIGYGVVHDQVTACICPEYFAVAHPPLCTTCSTTVLALLWGFVGTFWIGAVFGAVLARVASGGQQRVPFRAISTRVGKLLAAMAAAATVVGSIGWLIAPHLALPDSLAGSIPANAKQAFFAVWFAHAASYTVGLLGAGLVTRGVWSQAGRSPGFRFTPDGPLGWARVLVLLAILFAVVWVTVTG